MERPDIADQVRAAEVVLPCPDLEATLGFFTGRLGFRVETISPADDPRVAVVSGHGVRLRLERGEAGAPGRLRLLCRDLASLGGESTLTAPNGTRIELVEAEPAVALPPLAPSLVVSRLAGARWGTGRAGMRYRDLLPDRQGGRFIASHIQITDGGPVPDYVHFHRVRFQMIYCARGRVRVVYEDQGPPFDLEEGDAVLQPPGIRHRVLDSSAGLEVIEIGSPAAHETCADHDLALPTAAVDHAREFGGQRFAHHRAAAATWRPWRWSGLEARDLGITEATGGLAGARVARPGRSAVASHGGERGDRAGERGDRQELAAHRGELLFGFVLRGQIALECDGRATEPLAAGDAFAVPAGLAHRLAGWSADLELLEVSLPAAIDTAAGPVTLP
ncbi:MAG TPA: cupin domain-containing protein [Kofleriaceae bacterium]|nr:cupin domain-containing protein [Kofleriaceae bacterium]